MNLAACAMAAIVGAVFASFVSTAALRGVRGEGSVLGRSRCDSCGRSLGYHQTIPVVSFIAARGACGACKAPITPVHPAAELVGGSAAVALCLAVPWPQAGLMAAMAAALLAAAIVDVRTRILPDLLTAIVAVAAAALACVKGTSGILAGVIAAAASAGLLLLLRRGFVTSGRDAGLGLGDVKLVAALALWLGPATPAMVALASGLGLTFICLRPSPDGRIAFGPMIGAAGWGVGLAIEAGWWSA